MKSSHTLRPSSEATRNRCRVVLIVLAAALASLSSAAPFARSAFPQALDAVTIDGAVRSSAGEPVAGATVFLEEKGNPKPLETKTDVHGLFVFSAPGAGTYTVRAEKSGLRDCVSDPLTVSAGEKRHVNLFLEAVVAGHPVSSGGTPSTVTSPEAVEYEDKPNFTVAGVTDWSNLGLHASGTNVRTSEALAKQTLALQSAGPDAASSGASEEAKTALETHESETELQAALIRAPRSFEANHQLGEFYFHTEKYREAIPLLEAAYQISPGYQANAYDLALAYKANGDFARARDQIRKMPPDADTANLHRLLGDLDERLGDPLDAVHEYERAVRLDPSEQNYFNWGTELLLHRAAQPAVEVFTKGSSAHPDSARMLAGLGAALYTGGSYEGAARRLCDAADLNPADPAPYLFLGEMEIAAPAPLSCSEQKLARFAREQPGNALANYYYAVALRKRERGSEDLASSQQAEELLQKAVTIDPKLGEAYVQLGDSYSSRSEFGQAIAAYKKAIEVSPNLGEAHYRLGLAFKRIGEETKAHQEFQTYEQDQKMEAAAIERHRRELQQFLIVLQDQPAASPPH